MTGAPASLTYTEIRWISGVDSERTYTESDDGQIQNKCYHSIRQNVEV